MTLELVPGALDSVSGDVRYSPPFDGFAEGRVKQFRVDRGEMALGRS
jgi:hypothetical protein